MCGTLFFSFVVRLPPRSTLFPYTTLFRSFQNAGVTGRRLQHPVFDEKNVIAGALGHLALVVEHQGLDAAGLDRLDLGEDVVEVRSEERRVGKECRGRWATYEYTESEKTYE